MVDDGTGPQPAVIANVRVIGATQCTLPFQEQLAAIRWLTENLLVNDGPGPQLDDQVHLAPVIANL